MSDGFACPICGETFPFMELRRGHQLTCPGKEEPEPAMIARLDAIEKQVERRVISFLW